MNNAMKIAGFGLAAGAAAMIALSAPAIARGGIDGFGGSNPMGAMGGVRGGVFAVQFTDLDTDGNGTITEAELTARASALAAERLAGIDADGDGVVTAEEIETQIAERFGARAQDRPGQGQRQIDPADRIASRVAQMIAARDTNEDGVLSGDELSPAADMAALIDRFDTDDDNAWSEEEFAQVSAGKGARGAHGDHGLRGGRDGKRH